jgi:hypothetical protein
MQTKKGNLYSFTKNVLQLATNVLKERVYGGITEFRSASLS